MDDIVDHSKLSKGTIYYYYKSKKDLYLSLVDFWFIEYSTGILSTLDKKESASDQLIALFTYFIYYFKFKRCYEIFFQRKKNCVKEIYDNFSDEQISDKISELLSDEDVNAEVKIIFQPVENLHKACPKNLGDWYFTGDYPTAGGNRVVNRAFINFFEGNKERAYQIFLLGCFLFIWLI